MRTIKFRGARVNTGELVFGDLRHDGGHIYIDDKRVNPASVAQLVGYDRNDSEVYEGDTLNNIYGGTNFYVSHCKDRFFAHATLTKGVVERV